jgi:adenylate cyclase
LLEAQVAAGAAPAVTQLRVAGDALRRVADTEADWWRSEILEPLIRRGEPGARLGELTAEIATGMEDARDQALLAIYHAHEAHTWMRNIFEGLETMLERAGIRASVTRLPAIAFLDLTGYTRLTAQQGDEAGADLARRLGPIVQRLSNGHGGRPIKWLGDGVMFHFAEPAGAVLAALAMVDAAAAEGLPPARVGIHAGPVLFQEGDYFGRTVNVAARMSDYARPGEVLVTQEVVDAADDAPITFSGIGPVELKGLPSPIALFLARDGTAAHA